MPITVLIAEDMAIMRRAIRRLFEGDPEIEVVGETADFAQTITMMEQLKPRIVVMDLHMPNGGDVTPLKIKSIFTDATTQLVAISIWNDEDSRLLAASFGAAILLDKAALGINLVPTIKSLTAMGRD